jgi:hypothetical protein
LRGGVSKGRNESEPSLAREPQGCEGATSLAHGPQVRSPDRQQILYTELRVCTNLLPTLRMRVHSHMGDRLDLDTEEETNDVYPTQSRLVAVITILPRFCPSGGHSHGQTWEVRLFVP